MPAERDPASDNPELRRALAKEGIVDAVEENDTQPSFKMVGVNKIPVSKHLGSLWQSRLEQARSQRRGAEDNWSEAIRYYDNDQSINRNQEALEGRPGSRLGKSDRWTETENVVFANACLMLPMLYAKNPAVEMTPEDEDVYGDWATCCEKLVNKLLNMKTAPGLNVKSDAKRGILWALLTNSGYSKVGYIKKEDSHEQALNDLKSLSQKYQNAKDKREIEKIEGQLKALDERISLLAPSGPTFGLVSPFRLYIDPTSTKPDHSDANYIIEEDYLPTVYVNAVYGKDSDGKVISVYEPTHVLNSQKQAASSVEDQVNNFSLLTKSSDEATHNYYGYKSKSAFDRACYTKVFWVWDKTTRRLLLFADNKWDWPLWVWDDPLKLIEFYPYDHLHFHEQVEGSQPKGEVSYYLDQQDAINANNAAAAKARDWAKNNIFFDKNSIAQHDAEEVLKGPDGTARGVNLPEGKTLRDVIYSVVPPFTQHSDLFSNEPHFGQISRITGVNEAYKGAQFKTNTTNEAINFYKASVDVRVDEKIDAIEDWIGSIAWKILQLVAQHWTMEQVAEIVGPKLAVHWRQVSDPAEFRGKLSLTVVGGSTDKPTSKAKKRNALEIAQILGQFGNGLPAAGIIALRIIERAFTDEIVLTKEDWRMLHDSMNMAMNRAGGGAAANATGATDPNAAGGGTDPEAVRAQIAQLIQSLPPEGQAMLQQLTDQGVPPEQAIQTVMAQFQQPQAA